MSKIMVMTDSNSGISQSLGKDLGIEVLPMPFTVEGENYLEDINLTQEEFYRILKDNGNVCTSQPSPADLTETWERILSEYDEIVYIPMSSGLSGSCQTAIMLSEDFDGRVQVVNNQRISVTQYQAVLDAMELAGAGWDAKRIKDFLEEVKFDSSIYITLDTLYYLKKGGRITPAAAALGTILKLKPVLQIQGEKLDAYAKARSMVSAKEIMINAVKSDIEKRFGGDYHDLHLEIAHTDNEEGAKAFREEVYKVFPEAGEIPIMPLSLSVSCHIGPGALALACSKKIHY